MRNKDSKVTKIQKLLEMKKRDVMAAAEYGEAKVAMCKASNNYIFKRIKTITLHDTYHTKTP